ncbi:MAG: hypothetical protein J6N54_06260 [Bacteroidales bacterium]|nr:hypothetical protein [Bacteroidales bacterium]
MVTSAFLSAPAAAQEVNPDSWAATDALGRKVRSYDEAPAKRDGTFVAIFDWTWHTFHHDEKFPVYNITEILREHPEAIKDYNHPAWGPTGPHYYYWEQPLFGYYQTTDKWVLRKHAEMLAAAGVDAVFFDCTNGHQTWIPSYEALMETWDQAQKDGVKVPKIAFMLPFGASVDSRISLRQLYNDLYKPGRYKNLWFIWKGKPCIMGYPDNLTDDPTDKEIASFFTFRPGQPDYVDGPRRNDQWGWLENYPQHGYVPTVGADGKTTYEQVTVGVAQNTNPDRKGHCGAFNTKDAYGRNFSIRNGFDPRPDGYLYGWNIEEQWERAYELDPELVFVTGWNEYIAGKWLPKDSWNGDPFSFVDQYNWVCSRDIEPNAGWGDKGDVYYLQLVDNVRKFKGMVPTEGASAPKTVKINDFSDWNDVEPYFAAYKGNTFHRDNVGAGNTHYTDNSGRNDIVGAKVARDNDNIYFYVETADAMTPCTDPHWMGLFIDIDRDKSTGWYGYDFVVNRVSPSGSKAVIESNVQGVWMWNKAAEVKYYQKGNQMVIRVPRSVLGLGTGTAADFEFKWNDNMTKEGDIMDFYVSGDSAPFGRFNYVYSAK